MNGGELSSQSLSERFRELDERNRRNVDVASLGMRTAAEIFENIRRGNENSRISVEAERIGDVVEVLNRVDERNRQNLLRASLGVCTSADIFEASQKEHQETRARKTSGLRSTAAGRAGTATGDGDQAVSSAGLDGLDQVRLSV